MCCNNECCKNVVVMNVVIMVIMYRLLLAALNLKEKLTVSWGLMLIPHGRGRTTRAPLRMSSIFLFLNTLFSITRKESDSSRTS